MKITSVDPERPDVLEAVEIIRGGGVIAYPTDTLYGLGASLDHDRALERIYEIKGRDQRKPILFLIPDLASLASFVEEVPETARGLMETFWPGPLTLVFQASERVPRICLGEGTTIGVRWPDAPVVRALLRELKEPLTASSANRSGGAEPVTARQVADSIGDRVDLILDGGPCADSRPSTLIDVSGSKPRLLREGRISRERVKPFFP